MGINFKMVCFFYLLIYTFNIKQNKTRVYLNI